MIYIVRGKKVMLDSDLAILYGVETGALNRQVKRNIDRFPEDFMFQLTKEEINTFSGNDESFKNLMKQKKYLPYVFTEYGIAALSGVVHTEIAIKTNITIIRAFIKMRQILNQDQSLLDKIEKMEKGTDQLFRIVFERLDALEEIPVSNRRIKKRIGLR
jgi:hypothetical protein